MESLKNSNEMDMFCMLYQVSALQMNLDQILWYGILSLFFKT